MTVASWMLWASAVSLVLFAAARIADGAARGMGWRRRPGWGTALVLSALLPALSLMGWRAVPATPTLTPLTQAILLPVRRVDAAASGWWPGLDVLLVTVWLVVSLVLGVRMALAAAALRRAARHWTPAVVDGTRVMVSESVGPAVFGAVRPRVVLPRWALELPRDERLMVIAHERSHCRSHDAALLAAARALVVLLPWNVGLRLIVRRLRLAVEVDCDARVVAARGDVKRYATLLLGLAERALPPSMAMATLHEPYAHLHERITTMTAPSNRRPIHSAVAVVASLTLVALACATEGPSGSPALQETTARAANAPSAARSADGGTTPAQGMDETRITASTTSNEAERAALESEVEQPVRPRPGERAPIYPASLRSRGVEGGVLAQFVVDTLGVVERATYQTLQATDSAFAEAVRTAVVDMRFEPARRGGRAVRQVVQMPFAFALAK